MAVKLVCVVLAAFSSIACVSSAQQVVEVSPACGNASPLNCTQLDTALSLLQPNTALHLQPGVHLLQQYHGWTLRDLSHISIIGEGANLVRIKCSNTGLAFINATSLTISNIVIDSCGLTNASLSNVTETLKTFLDMTFQVPSSIRVGIFLAHCTDLKFSNSAITNTKGLGMLALNILGDSSLRNTTFDSNVCPDCSGSVRPDWPSSFDQHQGIGGGVYLYYQDLLDTGEVETVESHVNVSGCYFRYNAEHTSTAYYNIMHEYLRNSPNFSYVVGGGGGLTIYMPQARFPTVVDISDSIFHSNEAYEGGGAHIGLFAGFTVNRVQFLDCTFENNRLSNGGGGVAVFLDLLGDQNAPQAAAACEEHCKSVKFVGNHFTRNSALSWGGAMMIYSFSKTFRSDFDPKTYNAFVELSNCRFQHNSAHYGSAIFVNQLASQGLDGAWGLLLTGGVTVEENIAHCTISSGSSGTSCSDIISAVELRGMTALIGAGHLTIRRNKASGLHLDSSLIFMSPGTSLVVQGNRAHRGGGAYMDGYVPAILPSDNCTVVFRENLATAEGGGVYYETYLEERDLLDALSSEDCFIGPLSSYEDLLHSNVTVCLEDNEAPVGGTIFGSSLNSCSWARHFNVANSELLMFLHQKYNSTFKFSPVPQGRRAVSSEPRVIHVDSSDQNSSASPGQSVPIHMSVMDLFGNEIDAVITSDSGNKYDHNITLGGGEGNLFWYFESGHSIRLNVRGSIGNDFTLSLYTTSNLVNADVTINILECPIGFHYNHTYQRCLCDPLVNNRLGGYCEEDNVQLVVPAGKWLGCLSDTNCSSSVDLVLLDCYFSYCNPHGTPFDPANVSTQCANDSFRTGVMCGQCKPGYSMPLDSIRCHQCTGSPRIWVAVGLVVNFLGGLLLFLCISIFRITIEKGWTNAVIFFSNVVFPYTIFDQIASSLVYLLVPVRWMSLEGGIGRCFVNGLDSTTSFVFRLSFPIYLYVLMAVFAVLCRCSSFVSRHFSPTKTLVTLTFLTYISIFKTCASVISYVTVWNLARTESSHRWLMDPNVLYLQGWHGLLFAVALFLILAIVIPFPLLLVSPMLAYKYGGRRAKPFLDAIWAPFKPRWRIWASVRLVMRILVVMCGLFTSHVFINVNMLLLAMFLYLQLMIRPFKSNFINTLDNLLVLVAFFMNFGGYYWYVRVLLLRDYIPTTALEWAYCVALMCIAYVLILGSFLWHYRSPFVRIFKYLCGKSREQRQSDESDDSAEQPIIQSGGSHVASVRSEIFIPHRETFSHLRESLLEDIN